MNKQKLLKNYGLFFLQLIALLGAGLVFLFLSGWIDFKSFLLGGLAWLIPSFYFMRRLGQIKNDFSSEQMLGKFLLNEAVKLLFSFLFIVLILFLFTVQTIIFLGGYVFMVLVVFVTAAVYGKKHV